MSPAYPRRKRFACPAAYVPWANGPSSTACPWAGETGKMLSIGRTWTSQPQQIPSYLLQIYCHGLGGKRQFLVVKKMYLYLNHRVHVEWVMSVFPPAHQIRGTLSWRFQWTWLYSTATWLCSGSSRPRARMHLVWYGGRPPCTHGTSA